MIPSSHLLDQHAERLGLRSVEFPHEPEHAGEGVDPLHLLGEAQSGILAYTLKGDQVFEFVCVRHQLARGPVSDPDNVIAVCPCCEAERDAERFRLYYRLLHLRLTTGA